MARHMGAEVIGMSRSADKEKSARNLGVHDFINTTKMNGDEYESKLDLILCCAVGELDYDKMLDWLVPGTTRIPAYFNSISHKIRWKIVHCWNYCRF